MKVPKDLADMGGDIGVRGGDISDRLVENLCEGLPPSPGDVGDLGMP